MRKDKIENNKLGIKGIFAIILLCIFETLFLTIGLCVCGCKLYRDCVTIRDGNWMEVTVTGFKEKKGSRRSSTKWIIFFEYTNDDDIISASLTYNPPLEEKIFNNNLYAFRKGEKVIVLVSRWNDFMLYSKRNAIIRDDIINILFIVVFALLFNVSIFRNKKKSE